MADDIITPVESVLPTVLHTKRWLILETLLKRLDGLAKHTLVMLFDTVNETALDHLADQFSLSGNDGWAFVQTTQEKRALLKAAIEIHRYKGTVWAIRRTLELLGYGDSKITERVNFFRHDRSARHDGTRFYAEAGSWTHYSITMQSPITNEQAQQIRVILKDIAPLRCKLISINRIVLHNRQIRHNGTYTYGAI